MINFCASLAVVCLILSDCHSLSVSKNSGRKETFKLLLFWLICSADDSFILVLGVVFLYSIFVLNLTLISYPNCIFRKYASLPYKLVNLILINCVFFFKFPINIKAQILTTPITIEAKR